MGLLNAKDLRKRRFSFRKKRKQEKEETQTTQEEPKPKEVPVPTKTTKNADPIKPIKADRTPAIKADRTPDTIPEETSTPEKISTPENTPEVEEDDESVEIPTPKRNLLGELNVVEDYGDGTELILGIAPIDSGFPDDEPGQIPYNDDELASPTSEPENIKEVETKEAEETPSSSAPYSNDEFALKKGRSKAEDPPEEVKRIDDPPARKDPPPKEKAPTTPKENIKPEKTRSKENKIEIKKVGTPKTPLDPTEEFPADENPETKTPPSSPLEENRGVNEEEDDDIKQMAVEDVNKPESSWQNAEETARKLLGVFNCAEEGACVPEDIGRKVVETTCEPICGPIPISRSERRGLKRNLSWYNDQFAVKFLDEMLNVGFALIHHLPSGDGDWSGRSTTFILRPGTCNAQKSVPPCLEWTSMGGGTQSSVDTMTVSLLHIHSVTSSNVEIDEDGEVIASDSDEEAEELQCLFTLTAMDGEVHVFEAITAEETSRIVSGIKNLSARFSNQLVAGDIRAFTDFYSQHKDSEDIKLSPAEAMMRISNDFFNA